MVEQGYETCVFITDEHIPYVNEEMVGIVEQYLLDNKPKYRVHGGDLFDNPGMSDFDPDPNHRRDTQEEIDEVVQYLGRLHRASPDTKTVVLFGNHDYARLERKKSQVPYGMKNLRALKLPALIQESAREQEVEIGDVQFAKEWTLANSVTFFHGDPRMEHRMKGGVTGPRRTAEMFPGDNHLVMGHRHRMMVARDQWLDREVHQVAALLDPNFVHYNTHSKYENGFLVIHYRPQVRPKPEMHFQNVLLRNGGVMLDGKVYKRDHVVDLK